MKPKRVLITGIEGFAGSHLAELALSKGVDVFGTVRPGMRLSNLDGFKSKLHLFQADLLDSRALESAVKKSRPDWIIHLAGQSNVVLSDREPEQTMKINVQGTVNLLDITEAQKKDARILMVASANCYDSSQAKNGVISEKTPLKPGNHYAISKYCQELIGLSYHQRGMEVITVRPFNHIGPRQSSMFVASDFARQVAQIDAGLRKPVIQVGNIKVKRDFTDVRDVVRAYWLALEKGVSGEIYNICSNKAVGIDDLLHYYLSRTDKNVEIKVDRDKIRKAEHNSLKGSYQKIHKQTGWKPEILLQKTLKDIMNYWKKALIT